LLWTSLYALARVSDAGLVPRLSRLGPLGAVALLSDLVARVVRWRLPGWDHGRWPRACGAVRRERHSRRAGFRADGNLRGFGCQRRYASGCDASRSAAGLFQRRHRAAARRLRCQSAFAAVWDGHWWKRWRGVSHVLSVRAGCLGGARRRWNRHRDRDARTGGRAHRTATAEPRLHQVYVHLSSPYAAPRRFAAAEQIAGQQIPFSGSAVRTVRIAEWQLRFLHAWDIGRTAFDMMCAPAAGVARCRSGPVTCGNVPLRRTSVRVDRRDYSVPRGHHRSRVFASPFSFLAAMWRRPAVDHSPFQRALLETRARVVRRQPLRHRIRRTRYWEDWRIGIVGPSFAAVAVVGQSASGGLRSVPLQPLERLTARHSRAGARRCGGRVHVLVRTRGLSDYFFLMGDQIGTGRSRSVHSRTCRSSAPRATSGGNSFGPVYYWVLWASRVTIGPLVGQSAPCGRNRVGRRTVVRDAVLCTGIRRASGSWVFAVATVLAIASCPFESRALLRHLNPVLAVTFVKIGIGLLLAWANELTRTAPLVVFAVRGSRSRRIHRRCRWRCRLPSASCSWPVSAVCAGPRRRWRRRRAS
jgi:hypothetical protein